MSHTKPAENPPQIPLFDPLQNQCLTLITI
jgi:hypothetical protein